MRRNAVLDYARLWGSFGIVLFHSGAPGASVGLAALPFFLMLLVMLMAPGANQMTFAEFARSRATRLLIPWLNWSAVYGILKLTNTVASGEPLSAEFPPYVWLTGTTLHLWFLPFAFFACLALYPIARLRLGHLGFACLAAITVVLALALLGLQQNHLLPIPLAQWVSGGPAVLFGLTFAMANRRIPRLFLVIAALGIIIATAITLGWRVGILQLGIAGIALTICVLWYRPETMLSRWAARVSLGVYLSHPMVSSILGRLTPLPHESLALAISTMIGSVILAWLIDAVSQHKTPQPATTDKM